VNQVTQDLSVPTVVRNAQKFDDLPGHLQQRAVSMAEKQLRAEMLAKYIEDQTAAINTRRREVEVMKSELESLKSDLRTECRRHITNL